MLEEINKDSYVEASPVPINTPQTVVRNTLPIDIIEDQKKAEIYNRARLVKVLAAIDILFQIISLGIAMSQKKPYFYFFLFFPLCVFGFVGASSYKKNYLLAYVAYLIMMTIIYFILIIYTHNLWYVFFFLVEMYFFLYVGKLYNYLNTISEETKSSLRNGWNPDNVVILYI